MYNEYNSLIPRHKIILDKLRCLLKSIGLIHWEFGVGSP